MAPFGVEWDPYSTLDVSLSFFLPGLGVAYAQAIGLSFFLQGVGVGCPDPQAIGPPHHPLFS